MGIDTNKYRELYKENKQLQNKNDLDDTKATSILMNTLTFINNKKLNSITKNRDFSPPNIPTFS